MLDGPWLVACAVAGLVLSLLALAYAVLAQVRVRSMRATVAALQRAPVTRDARRALQRVGLVRYDAFPGSGGRLSWSVAVLDGAGDGVVITTLTARSESRSYAKAVRGGRGVDELSPEESDAVARAMSEGAG